MKYVLWAQNESTDKAPTIIVDDRIITDSQKQEDAYAVICEKNENLKMSPEYREDRFKESKELYRLFVEKGYEFNSNTFTISSNFNVLKDGIYLQGAYIDVDVRGRQMPFMFFAFGVTSMDEAQQILIDASSKIGRTCNTFELAYLKLISNKGKKSKKKIIVTIGVMLILLIILLIIANGK